MYCVYRVVHVCNTRACMSVDMSIDPYPFWLKDKKEVPYSNPARWL